MKRAISVIVAAALIIVVASVGGYFAYAKHIDNKLIDAQVPAVKNTSLRVANALTLGTSGNIMYREIFARLDKEIIDVDQKQLQVQTATTPSTAKWIGDRCLSHGRAGGVACRIDVSQTV